MKKIFLKEYKTNVARYSWKYWFAVVVELLAIVLWTIGLLEIKMFGKFNPANYLIHIGGLLFVIGSMIFAKFVKVK